MSKTPDDKILKDAQYRKSLGIAFFNANNSAIQLVTSNGSEATQESIIKWRDWFLEEHKNYWATTIMNVGKNYDVKTTIDKIKACKTKGELVSMFTQMSADERNDELVIMAKNEKKEELSTIV